jgi:drug/metabolite transporter (DMT)-like permease
LKRATTAGAGVWRTTRVCNFITAAFFAPLWLLGGALPGVEWWWQPAVVALLFVLGQVLTVLALRVGDVSIATPVLGLKVILVALFVAALLREPLTGRLWIAAGLSSAGIALLHFSRPPAESRIGATILLAGMAAAAYALFDVLVQKWSPAWGAGRFLPVLMGVAAVYSLLLRSPNREPESGNPAPAAPWVVAGGVCLALQAVMLVSSIAVYRHAAAANVLYSSRGLWSVLAVWLVGQQLGIREAVSGPGVLLWRLAGAAALMAAVAVAVSGSGS